MGIYYNPCHFSVITLSYCRIYCDVVCINAKATMFIFVKKCVYVEIRCEIIELRLNSFERYRD